MKLRTLMLGLCSASALAFAAQAETITIATVNNGDMIRMQGLTDDFTAKNPDIQLEWVTLEENVLRERVTTDIATKGGQFDVMTIGTYEVPIWAKQDWLVPLDNLGADYDVDDLLPAIAGGLSVDGKLYAAPFYGESSMVMYRKDLMEKAGLTMPDAPTWEFIADAARKMTDREQRHQRHLPARQGRLGREHGLPDRHVQLVRRPLVRRELEAAVRSARMEEDARFLRQADDRRRPAGRLVQRLQREPGAVPAGQVRHVDRRHGRRFLRHQSRRNSTVADKVGFALAPDNGLGKRGNWLWAWSLAIPAGTQKADAAQKFISWATGKGYLDLVASKEGWANVPPGTRTSLYNNPEYQKAAPFAKMTLDSINSADPTKPTVKPVPYVGVQFVAIPEFQGLGTTVGQLFSAALAGQMTVDDALKQAQDAATAR